MAGSSNRSTKSKETVYIFEKVVDKRMVGGQAEYLVKWKDYPASQNTWEPVSSFKDTYHIQKYEEEQVDQVIEKKKTNVRRGTRVRPGLKIKIPSKKQKESMNKVKAPGNSAKDKLIEMYGMNESGLFLVRYDGSDHIQTLSREEMNEKHPQEVIKYYESRLVFNY